MGEGAVACGKFSVVEKLSENLLVRKCLSKNAKFWLVVIHFEKFEGKIKISSAHNPLC